MTATRLRALTRTLGAKSPVYFVLEDGHRLELVHARFDQDGRDGKPTDPGDLTLVFRSVEPLPPDPPPAKRAGRKESPPPGTDFPF